MARQKHSIEKVIQEICKCAAQAVSRYAEISGDGRASMPEYFMPAFIFEKLGSAYTMTLESNSTTLGDWNNDTKGRRRGPVGDGSGKNAELETAIQSLGRRGRIDLIVFDGGAQQKSHEDFLIMVEFKRWNSKYAISDREKLLRVMATVDTCPAGAIVYLVNTPADSEWIRELKAAADQCADQWFCEPIPDAMSNDGGEFAICAQLFQRNAQITHPAKL